MARTGRTRNRSITFRGKERTTDLNGTPISSFDTVITTNSSISDSHGRPLVPSSLTLSSRTGMLFLDGYSVNEGNSRIYVYDGVPFFQGSGESPNKTLTPVKSGWELDLVAGTNPSRPVFTPPQFLQDLIELPKLLRETGNLLRKPQKLFSAREAANAHLAARFGWFPLIDDLIKLLGLQKTILNRKRELANLYSGRGLRRRLKFGKDTKVYRQEMRKAQYGTGLVSVGLSVTVTKEEWGTIVWRPKDPVNFVPGDEELNRQALKLAFGLTVEGMAKGAWDVIPWTWLLGWFTNVGKLTLATSNTVPASWSEACLMRMVSTSVTADTPVYSGKVYKLSANGQYSESIKTRLVGTGSILPGFNMPFLDMSRLSVLGSLFVQRLKR